MIEVKISDSGKPTFKKSGNGYWATFYPNEVTRPLDQIGYNIGNIYRNLPFIDFDPNPAGTAAQQQDYGLGLAFNNHALGAFLYKMYKAGIDISREGDSLNLDEQIEAAGAETDYAGVNPLDFMYLTGAKILYEGLEKYLPNPLDPSYVPPPRPNLWEVEDGDKEARANMFQVVKYIGLWGLLKYLLVIKGGITYDEFMQCLFIWKPLYEDRAAYFPVFRAFMIDKQQPKLTQEQIAAFLKADE